MWSYDKRLQFPVKIKNPNPQTAKIVISQLGGPDGQAVGHRVGPDRTSGTPCRIRNARAF